MNYKNYEPFRDLKKILFQGSFMAVFDAQLNFVKFLLPTYIFHMPSYIFM